jgi:acetylornithine deacetylase
VTEQAQQATQLIQARAPELAALVAEAVRTQSVTGAEGPFGQVLADWLRADGLDVAVTPVPAAVAQANPVLTSSAPLSDRPNIFATWRAAAPTVPPLVLNGHQDTVPGGDVEAWGEHGPFSGARADSRIWGRGSSDMKGGLIAAMFAIRCLREVGVTLACDVQLQAVVGEESGGLGALGALATEPRPGGAIVLEPTECRVAPASGGAVIFEIVAHGRAAHTGLSYLGVSALEKLWSIYVALRELSAERNERFDHALFADVPVKAPFGVGTFSAGEWIAMVPDRAVMTGRLGVLPGEHLDDVRAQLLDTIDGLVAVDPWLREHRPVVRWPNPGFAAWATPIADPVVQALIEGVRSTGGDARPTGMTYASDAGHFAAAGVPVTLFGPGSITRAHLPGEFITEDELVRAAAALAHAIVNYSQLSTVDTQL